MCKEKEVKKARVQVSLTPEVAVKSLEKANELGLSRSAVIEQSLRKWLQNKGVQIAV